MHLRYVGLLAAVLVAAGCQDATISEQGMQETQWVTANPAAERVYHDSNMDVWNQGERCYYFIKDRLEHNYQCGNLGAVE